MDIPHFSQIESENRIIEGKQASCWCHAYRKCPSRTIYQTFGPPSSFLYIRQCNFFLFNARRNLNQESMSHLGNLHIQVTIWDNTYITFSAEVRLKGGSMCHHQFRFHFTEQIQGLKTGDQTPTICCTFLYRLWE